ncbi:MAG: hypothetical protein ABI183_01625 [Polyangiaceae bacterium]
MKDRLASAALDSLLVPTSTTLGVAKLDTREPAVLAHAEAEEKDELDKLGDKLEPARLDRKAT